uniref:FERM domain containing 4A n=1 Tax=Gorilla gorilla gorilla TaxID=9595 RepID=A0A2I2YZ28_GORGO
MAVQLVPDSALGLLMDRATHMTTEGGTWREDTLWWWRWPFRLLKSCLSHLCKNLRQRKKILLCSPNCEEASD